MAQKLFALFVAINDYHPTSGVLPLTGCINDIDATQKLLLDNFSTLQPNIRRLTNQEATYANTVAQFQEHLIANAAPNTTLLFWFSGHGAQQSTDARFYKYLPEDDLSGRKDETLICYDSRAIVNGKLPYPDLADKELAVLIDRAAQKGSEVITVFDCCHSGSITRSSPEKYIRTRLGQDRDEKENELAKIQGIRKPFTRNYLNGYYQKNQINHIPTGRHMLLAACQYYETAKECSINGIRQGIFSYYLQQVIAQNPAITYTDLFEQVRSAIATESIERKFSSPQTPQFAPKKGFEKDHCIFTRQKPTYLSNKYEIVYDKATKEWQIKYGANLGLPTSGKVIEFAVYENPPLGPVFTEAHVKQVNGSYSTIVSDNPMHENKRYWGELIQLEDVPVCLTVEGNPQAQKRLEAFIHQFGSTYFALDNAKKSDFRIVFTQQDWWQLFKSEERLLNEPFIPGEAFNKLNRLGRWHLLLNNQKSKSKIKIPRLNFCVEDTQRKQKITGTKPFQSKDFVCTLNDDQEWVLDTEIKGQNYTNKRLFFTVLYFTSDYGIELVYNRSVDSNKLFTIEDKEFVIDKDTSTQKHLQLFVSTQKNADHFFTQSGIHSTGRIMRTKKIKEDWCTVTIKLNLQKEDVSM